MGMKGMKWETGDSDDFKPTFSSMKETPSKPLGKLSITPTFGPRDAETIKIFVASIAAPAKPEDRNDTVLIE